MNIINLSVSLNNLDEKPDWAIGHDIHGSPRMSYLLRDHLESEEKHVLWLCKLDS
jgi:hypothetical protein